MADKTTGELNAVSVGDLEQIADIYDDTLIPVEHQGEARHMSGAQWKKYAEKAASSIAKGDDGKDFKILGYFTTLDGLAVAVTSPDPGDAYGVGETAPYDIYIWDGVNLEWVNNGPIQGPEGPQGVSGVYVGSGDMPEGYNVQIDPEGDEAVMPVYSVNGVGPDENGNVVIEGGTVTGDYIPTPTTAEVGQVIAVKTVDEDGKPTEWEAVDMESGGGETWELISSGTLEADTWRLFIDKDANGNPFSLKKARFMFRGTATANSIKGFQYNSTGYKELAIHTDTFTVVVEMDPVRGYTYLICKNGVPTAGTVFALSIDGPITSIEWKNNNGTGNLAAGSTYTFYGVRA